MRKCCDDNTCVGQSQVTPPNLPSRAQVSSTPPAIFGQTEDGNGMISKCRLTCPSILCSVPCTHKDCSCLWHLVCGLQGLLLRRVALRGNKELSRPWRKEACFRLLRAPCLSFEAPLAWAGISRSFNRKRVEMESIRKCLGHEVRIDDGGDLQLLFAEVHPDCVKERRQTRQGDPRTRL